MDRMSDQALAVRIAEMREEGRNAWRNLMDQPDGSVVQTGAGVPLKRSKLAIQSGSILIEATEDGGPCEASQWHTGFSGDVVYYERWENGARRSHGYIDKASRHLVQSG